MKLIPVSRGTCYAVVDDEDFERLSKFKWYVIGKNKSCIVRHNKKKCIYTGRTEIISVVSLAQEIMNRWDARFDHIDRDFKNNQKYNIRETTTTQNNQNRGKIAGTSSKYKGVSWHSRRGRWRARIGANGRYYDSNDFKNEEDAAKWYNEMAIKYHKEFAVLNTIETVSTVSN